MFLFLVLLKTGQIISKYYFCYCARMTTNQISALLYLNVASIPKFVDLLAVVKKKAAQWGDISYPIDISSMIPPQENRLEELKEQHKCSNKPSLSALEEKIKVQENKIRVWKARQEKYEKNLRSKISQYVLDSFGIPKKAKTSYVLGETINVTIRE